MGFGDFLCWVPVFSMEQQYSQITDAIHLHKNTSCGIYSVSQEDPWDMQFYVTVPRGNMPDRGLRAADFPSFCGDW